MLIILNLVVYHMAKQYWRQTIYVRKKFHDKRKWIPIGWLNQDNTVELTITDDEAQFLVRDSDSMYNWFKKVAKKWFN